MPLLFSLGLDFVALIDKRREQDLSCFGQQSSPDSDALNGVRLAEMSAKDRQSGVRVTIGPVSNHSRDIAVEPSLLIAAPFFLDTEMR